MKFAPVEQDLCERVSVSGLNSYEGLCKVCGYGGWVARAGFER